MSTTEIAAFSFKIVLYIAGALGVALTALPFFRFNSWWIRIGEFPRVQIAVLCGLVVFGLLLYFRSFAVADYAVLTLLALCAIYQVYCIVPYTPLYPEQVEQSDQSEPKNRVKILIANVFIENRETEKLVGVIRSVDPDVILLAEPDEFWVGRLTELEDDYRYTVKKPLSNAYGMALYSRFELENPEIQFLIEEDVPSIHTRVKLPSGRRFQLYGVHPKPPVPGESLESTERDAELIVVGKAARELKLPVVVAGDLNDVAWSRTTSLFQRISGLLDPRIGRGFYNSFHADHWLIRFPLDHVFHSSDFRLVRLQRLGDINSDHFPIFVELSLESNAPITQETPEQESGDEEEAEETLIEAVEKEARENGSNEE